MSAPRLLLATFLTICVLAGIAASGTTLVPDGQGASVPLTSEERYLAQVRAAVARGDVDAEVALGNLYESGETLPFDLEQAAAWYRRAAEKGHVGAQVNLAMMYQDGQGVPRDLKQAVAWYEKAAAGGDAVAGLGLGSLYEKGADGVPRDLARAVAAYRQAAERGLAGAQYRLGLMYRDGRGAVRDERQAIAWLRKAADQGDEDAQIDLGVLLSPGHGSADIVEAHAWLNLAASRWKHEDKRLRAARLRDRLEHTMTNDQRAQAYRRAIEWQDGHAWRAIRGERAQ